MISLWLRGSGSWPLWTLLAGLWPAWGAAQAPPGPSSASPPSRPAPDAPARLVPGDPSRSPAVRPDRPRPAQGPEHPSLDAPGAGPRTDSPDAWRDERGLFATVAEAPGAAATTNRLGRWRVDGSTLVSMDGRGFVEYSLTTRAPDRFRLEVAGGDVSSVQLVAPLELWLSMDGEFLGRVFLASSNGAPGLAHALTPWLQPGSHTVRVFWDNARRGRALQIAAVRLQSLAGTDADGDGVTDWVQVRLRAENGLESQEPVLASLTSPAFLEGRARFPGLARIRRGQGTVSSAVLADLGDRVHAGAGARWHADVPLERDQTTSLEVSFENGGLKDTRAVIWTPVNVLESDALTIRRGDALLLVARPDNLAPTPEAAGMVIQIAGVTNHFGVTSEEFVHRFDEAGTYEVTGACLPDADAPLIRSITVTVVSGALGNPPPALVGQAQTWDCPDLPAGAVVEADPRLRLEPAGPLPAGGRRWRVTADAPEPRVVVARIRPGGPIFASAQVQGFRLFQNAETFVQEAQVYPDGSQRVEMGLVLSPVLPGVTVRLDLLTGGAVFDDGMVMRVLQAAAFNTLGQSSVSVIRSSVAQSSVCHSTTVSTSPSSSPSSNAGL